MITKTAAAENYYAGMELAFDEYATAKLASKKVDPTTLRKIWNAISGAGKSVGAVAKDYAPSALGGAAIGAGGGALLGSDDNSTLQNILQGAAAGSVGGLAGRGVMGQRGAASLARRLGGGAAGLGAGAGSYAGLEALLGQEPPPPPPAPWYSSAV